MPSVFFKISTTDLTGWEDIQSHEVNLDDVYETWTDGNWVDHRVVARTRVTGKVKLGFSKSAEYASFIALLTSARTAGGYYSVTVYCNNTGATSTVDAYLDISEEDSWDLTHSRQWQVVTIKITGR